MTNDLSTLGVQELNAREIRKIEGGWPYWITISGGWFNTVNLTPTGSGGPIYA